jgi:hypothetical protein
MNGPAVWAMTLIARHWQRRTSNWAQAPIASAPARATIRAPLSRTAAISARLAAMLWSRVMTSQPWRVTSEIQAVSGTDVEVTGQLGRVRL